MPKKENKLKGTEQEERNISNAHLLDVNRTSEKELQLFELRFHDGKKSKNGFDFSIVREHFSPVILSRHCMIVTSLEIDFQRKYLEQRRWDIWSIFVYRYESIGNLYSILIEAVFNSVFLLSWEIFSNDYLNASIDSWTISRDQFIEEIFDKRKVKDKHAKIFYLVSNNHLISFFFFVVGLSRAELYNNLHLLSRRENEILFFFFGFC